MLIKKINIVYFLNSLSHYFIHFLFFMMYYNISDISKNHHDVE